METKKKLKIFLPFEKPLVGRKILVTGHTGFTGSWACMWLKAIGSEVYGFSLPPETSPALYEALGLSQDIPSVLGDICDYEILLGAIKQFQPELVIHLAAQPLVRRSYKDPVETFAVNTLGTAHVLNAAKTVKSIRAVLCITTDKVYQNNEWQWPYRENDRIGGKDPYSASKAAAEMVIQCYAASFPWTDGTGPALATARGGNIIGGGDWSEDRLIPDFVRAVTDGTTLNLRYPDAVRPWQHVLALVQGYLMILAGLISNSPEQYAQAWNLGPLDFRQHSVRQVLELMSEQWIRPELAFIDNPLPEAGVLALDSTIARNILGWMPPWETEQVVAETAAWYREYYRTPDKARELTLNQIDKWRKGLFS